MPSDGNLIHPLLVQVQRLSQAALDLVFPPRCVVCRRPGAELCDACRGAFPRLPGPLCGVCSLPLGGAAPCAGCRARPPSYRRLRSAYSYEGTVRRAVLAFKYEGRRRLAAPLAAALGAVIPADGSARAVLCAVPMHHEREAERGYNHATLLAQELGRLWHAPVLPPEALRRTRQTTAQVGLDYHTRLTNLKGAFHADRPHVDGQVVLLVDDVCTTGSTLNACAEALLGAGAAVVECVTLARTL
mgnify:CR=1 FL=1